MQTSSLIRSSRVSGQIALAFALIVGFSAPVAYAGVDFHGSFTAGAWFGGFNQSSGAQEAKFSTSVGPAFAAQLGIGYDIFFGGLQAHWFVPASDDSPHSHAASYYSLLGAHAGVVVPFVPERRLEIYGGIEDGNYGLSGNPDPDYDGPAVMAGGVFYFTELGAARIGLRFEYRRFNAIYDDAGKIPDGISTHAHLYLLGVTLGFGGGSK